MSTSDNMSALLVGGGIVLLFGLCCGTCLFDSPGPSWGSYPCMLDDDTLRYNVEIGSADAPMMMHKTAEVGDQGSVFEVFSAVDPLDDGTYRATFTDTLNDKTSTMILHPCEE